MSRRSRRRKAGQLSSKSKSPWVGRLVVGGLVVVLLLVVGVAVGFQWLKGYLRSEEFRVMLEGRIGRAVGGQAELAPLDWEGAAVQASRLELEGKKVGRWEVEGLETRVDLNAIWGEKVWRLPEVEIGRAGSVWDLRGTPAVDVAAKPVGKKVGGGGLRAPSFLPERAEVERVMVGSYEGAVLTGAGDYRWRHTRAEMERVAGGDVVLGFEGGRVETPLDWLGTMRLREGSARVGGGRVDITASDWFVFEDGILALTGGVKKDHWNLEGEFEDVACVEVVPGNWRKKVEGSLGGTFLIGAAEGEPLRATGKVVVEEGGLSSLAVLDRLAAYAGTGRFRRLTLQEAEAGFVWQADGWELREVVLENAGLVRVEGNLKVSGEELDGRFEVGVPPGLLAHIPGAEEKVFLPGKRGMLWTPLRVTGTLKDPKEDLSERMIRAAGERMFEIIPETGQWALRYGGRAMDEGTAAILENHGVVIERGTKVMREVLEEAPGVVEEGVRTGVDVLNSFLGGGE